MVVWLKPCKSRSLPGAYTETLQLLELGGFFFGELEYRDTRPGANGRGFPAIRAAAHEAISYASTGGFTLGR